jgi:hypothetical protein
MAKLSEAGPRYRFPGILLWHQMKGKEYWIELWVAQGRQANRFLRKRYELPEGS